MGLYLIATSIHTFSFSVAFFEMCFVSSPYFANYTKDFTCIMNSLLLSNEQSDTVHAKIDYICFPLYHQIFFYIHFIFLQVDGIICSFEEAIPQLIFFQKKTSGSTNWNSILDIGEDFKIPVTGRIKVF